jgi:hypothetical protein
MDSAWIKKLCDRAAFPHPVEKVQLIETHVSWVLLTGEYVYKIKKPVDLGFVDFTSLARRHHFCLEELRLNKRTTPDLYLDVVPIADTAEGPKIGQLPAVEYALKMRQFPAGCRLDQQLTSGRLRAAHMRGLARMIAEFHESLSAAEHVYPARELALLRRFTLDNFDQIRAIFSHRRLPELLSRIESWTQEQLMALAPVFEERASRGFIRECHGDLHLANTAVLDGRIILFDCLEFDPELRWIDLINDVGFMVMDLIAHGRDDLAFIFLNAYLEQTGDYRSIAVLRFYLVYRCMVRAKVAALQPGAADDNKNAIWQYLWLAHKLVNQTGKPHLLIMHGFSGSGKTWLSDRLLSALPAIRVRSDLARKHLHGLKPLESSASDLEAGLYTSAATDRTYEFLADCCETGLRAHFDMIADATFLHQGHRAQFLQLANRLQIAPVIVDCTVSTPVLRQRILTRATDPEHVSEADLAVLDHQLAHHDPLTANERKLTVQVSLEEAVDFPPLVQLIRNFN